jgi:Heterokaryon incompatibility protein (HET)
MPEYRYPWSDIEDAIRGLANTARNPSVNEVNNFINIVWSVYHGTYEVVLSMAEFLRPHATNSSGIPLAMHRAVNQTAERFKTALLDSAPNSFVSVGISHQDKELLYSMLSSSFDVVRELYDMNDPTRQLADFEYWITWAKMEIHFTWDDVIELLHTRTVRAPPRSPAYPYQPLLPTNGIRLLIIRPDTDPDSDIRCNLIFEPDYTKRRYAALSYVWGNSNDPERHIILDGASYPVTPSLHTALKHFRHHLRRRIIWADAICINQSDDAEKNTQVSQMKQIYQSSACILMWVGEAGIDGPLAIKWFREVNTSRGNRSIDTSANHSNPNITKLQVDRIANACSSDTIRNHWRDIRKFLRRPYWNRVWILQEAIAREDSLICCGAYGMLWQTLRTMVRMVPIIFEAIISAEGEKALPRKELVASLLTMEFQKLKFHVKFVDQGAMTSPVPFLTGLIASRTCSATDPRDHIFSIKGFVKDFPVIVDYRKPAYRLYLETAQTVLQQTGKLDILTLCKEWDPEIATKWSSRLEKSEAERVSYFIRRVLSGRSLSATLLRWSDIKTLLQAAENPSMRSKLPFGTSSKEVIEIINKVALECLPSWVPRWHWRAGGQYILLNQDDPRSFKASGDFSAQMAFGNEGSELSLQGVKVDVVTAVIKILRADLVARTQVWDFWKQKCPQAWRYPSQTNREDAFYRTMLRDNSDSWFERTLFRWEMNWDNTDKENLDAAELIQEEPEMLRQYEEMAARNGALHTFIICEDGHIGLGPYNASVGDSVCVLRGGDVPFILRRYPLAAGRRYCLMGEACE